MFSGRINRMRYVVAMLALAAFMGIGAGIAAQLDDGGAKTAILSIVLLVYAAGHLTFVAKRLRDIGRPGWHVVLLAVPLYNIYLSLVLLFKPGTQGRNAYGADPLSAEPAQARLAA